MVFFQSKIVPMLASVFLLSGCEAAIRGAPEPSLDPGRDVAAIIIDEVLDRGRLRALAVAPNATVGQRNSVIFARMAEIDVLYYAYERDLSRELRQSDFLTGAVGVGVGAAGALVSEAASQVLSGLSGAIAGLDQSFDETILIQRTTEALISQMRAERATVRAEILGKTQAQIAAYPLTAALSDLAKYRQAGTLNSALAAVSRSAAAEEVTAQRGLDEVEARVFSIRYGQNPNTVVLAEYLEDVTLPDEEVLRRLQLAQAFIVGQRGAGLTDCPPAVAASEIASTDSAQCRQLQADLLSFLQSRGEI